MTINSFDIVFYTSIFILPGFIIKGIINSLTPPKRISEGLYFLSCLAYSICNLAIWSWLYKIIFPLHISHENWYWLSLIFITILGSLIVAIIIGIIKQKHVIINIFKKLKINIFDTIPTAWDFVFEKQEPSWLIVTLIDDTTIMGLYSNLSYSSSDYEERDIYIEEIYNINENEEWIKNNKSKGIYIPKNMIKTIEFLI